MQHRLRRAALVATLLAGACTREVRVMPTPASPLHPTPAARLTGDPRMAFAEAVGHVERGEDESARPLFLMLVDRYPQLEDYHLAYLAALEERAGRLVQAARFDDRLLASHPDSVWVASALARRARVALALGDRATAANLAALVASAPGADSATRGAAEVVEADLLSADDPRAAYVLYQTARRRGGDTAAVARTRSAALENVHPRLLEDAELQLDEGTLLLAEGQLESAAERLERASGAADPSTRAAALRTLAKTRKQQGRIDDAILVYRSAAEAEPPPGGTAWYELATLLWNRDRDDEAEALFSRLLREAPRHPKRDSARYALGRIAEQAGNRSEAAAHYRRLVASGTDSDLVREASWRIAWGAYRAGADAAAIEAFAALAHPGGADESAGLYWLARMRATRHGPEAATSFYSDVLARVPDTYYAGLAEQRLGTTAPPPPQPEPLAGDAPPTVTAQAYHWTRSQELHAAAFDRAAAREIDAVARALDAAGTTEPFLVAAYAEVGAHDRALRLAGTLQGRQAISAPVAAAYLYPRAYWTLVSEEADAARLDPYVVLALMRQESLFDADARSPADAYGLMQLLVRTAVRTAGTPVTAAELTDPALNVRLGTRHLRELLDRFDGNLVKALAAYNAGEDAVVKWEARSGVSEDDEFVEDISFRETRKYVKTVLGNYRRYRRLYGAPGEQRAVRVEERSL
jgi:soluble lytic murein transglycosylase